MKILRKLNFWNFIFQSLVLEFLLVSFNTHIGTFENLEFEKILKKIWKNFRKLKKKI
jgi:hypothetical protein